MRFFILISYNGSNLNGWQKQQNGVSVQEHLENAFSVYLKEKILVTGAGRTDTGVHARNYVAHFDSLNLLTDKESQYLFYKINAILPRDIVLHEICQVDKDAHARFDAVSRTYNYYVNTVKDPFCREFSFFHPHTLDLEAMNEACKLIMGVKDFTSMAKLHSDTKTNICTVTEAKWEFIDNTSHTHLRFTVTANRFLRNMVRALVGTMLEIGSGKHSPQWITYVLDQKERGAAGSSAPAHALFFSEVQYPYITFRTNR